MTPQKYTEQNFEEHIEEWLRRWRLCFLSPEDWFWPSTKGGCLAYTYVGTLIARVTSRELGVSINPHLFRDCAVLTVADLAGDRMSVASGLLQHTDPRVTEKHYNRGASRIAARKLQSFLLGPKWGAESAKVAEAPANRR